MLGIYTLVRSSKLGGNDARQQLRHFRTYTRKWRSIDVTKSRTHKIIAGGQRAFFEFILIVGHQVISLGDAILLRNRAICIRYILKLQAIFSTSEVSIFQQAPYITISETPTSVLHLIVCNPNWPLRTLLYSFFVASARLTFSLCTSKTAPYFMVSGNPPLPTLPFQ